MISEKSVADSKTTIAASAILPSRASFSATRPICLLHHRTACAGDRRDVRGTSLTGKPAGQTAAGLPCRYDDSYTGAEPGALSDLELAAF